jgi:Tfp pilus assembly protein PilV
MELIGMNVQGESRRLRLTGRVKPDGMGFSIVEILIAIVILGLALLGFAGVTFYSINQVHSADMVSVATTLAMDQLEAIKALPYEEVTSGSDPNNPVTQLGEPEGSYTREWTVQEDTPDAGTKTVRVTVSYADRERDKQVQVFTIIAEPPGSEVQT